MELHSAEVQRLSLPRAALAEAGALPVQQQAAGQEFRTDEALTMTPERGVAAATSAKQFRVNCTLRSHVWSSPDDVRSSPCGYPGGTGPGRFLEPLHCR